MKSSSILFLLAVAGPLTAGDWPQFLGPTGDGHYSGPALPTAWGPDKNVVWKFKVPGPGSSTPCVWGDNIFFTSVDGADVALLCVGTDGAQKWKVKVAPAGKSGRAISVIAASETRPSGAKEASTS